MLMEQIEELKREEEKGNVPPVPPVVPTQKKRDREEISEEQFA